MSDSDGESRSSKLRARMARNRKRKEAMATASGSDSASENESTVGRRGGNLKAMASISENGTLSSTGGRSRMRKGKLRSIQRRRSNLLFLLRV